LGIEIEHVSIPYLFPPAQVKEAFDRLGQTKNNVEARLKQARQEADRRKSDLAGTMYNLRTLALKYAEVEPDKAETDAMNFRNRLQQYRTLSATNPDYLNTLWLDDMTRLYAKMRAAGQIDLLDHYLTEGVNITQFPLQSKKK
jgi:regulator of protease activity HflC (stomatin/prohibitin superfamily)